jgi:uncharacterized protein
MRTLLSLVFAALLLSSLPALALDLQAAKQQGLVGETPSGYLGVVASGNAEAQKLVDSINGKRKAEYEKIAKKNKIPLANVEQLAGKQAIEKTPAGNYIKAGGGWKKK